MSLSNATLGNLCGPLDAHLRRIEAALGVTVLRRGESFTVKGDAASSIANAHALLAELAGDAALRALSAEDIELALVKFTRGTPVEKRQAAADDEPVLRFKRTELKGRTPAQVKYLQQIMSHDITFGIGPAGTGKTYLAVACAVDALERDLVKRILLTRPAVEAGERLGFLPGDLSQKIDPYLRPLYDALHDLIGMERVTKLLERGALEIAPLAFMRGRTINHSFVILDEAQNTTPEQMKMFLTRIGYGSRAVVTGDVSQVDLPRGHRSGLVDAGQVLRRIDGIAITEFASVDVVRHPLVSKIVDAYDARDSAERQRST